MVTLTGPHFKIDFYLPERHLGYAFCPASSDRSLLHGLNNEVEFITCNQPASSMKYRTDRVAPDPE